MSLLQAALAGISLNGCSAGFVYRFTVNATVTNGATATALAELWPIIGAGIGFWRQE